MPNDREIERKYLLRALPALPPGTPSADIDQGYLPGTKIYERVRRVRENSDAGSSRYYRTVKVGKGVDRQEFEEQTTQDFFETVWPLTRGHRIQKRRHRARIGHDAWEIDEFLDRDLVLAELELERVDQRIDMPDFIQAVLIREVTEDDEYSNFRMSK